jgi:ribosome-associated toxin RatA of RatAB toxin-antitoxin module
MRGKNSFTYLLRAVLVAACAALSCGTGSAADDISLAFFEGYGHYKVEGSFFVDADNQTAWDVLTNYDHIPDFVHSMKISKVEQRDNDDLVLRQEGEGSFLFFSKRIRLLMNVHEQPQTNTIIFTDTSHQDFSSYQGTWSIVPSTSGHGLEVIYTLDAAQNFSAPAFIASDVVKGNVQDLLQSLKREIAHRQMEIDQELAARALAKAKTLPSKLNLALKSGNAVDSLAVQVTPVISHP